MRFSRPRRIRSSTRRLVEIFYHTLWETVHVFFEHRELGQDVGQTEFLYPFLGQKKQETTDVVEEVAASIQMKVHDDSLLRARLAGKSPSRLETRLWPYRSACCRAES